jgi:hypothetical protein
MDELQLKHRHRNPSALPLDIRPCAQGHTGEWKPVKSGSYVCAVCMLEAGRRSRTRKANSIEALSAKRDRLITELAEVTIQIALKEVQSNG